MNTSFAIMNDTGKELIIVHEPECTEFVLPIGDEVSVEIDSCANSIAIRVSHEDNQSRIALLGHKGLYNVTYKSEAAFEE